ALSAVRRKERYEVMDFGAIRIVETCPSCTDKLVFMSLPAAELISFSMDTKPVMAVSTLLPLPVVMLTGKGLIADKLRKLTRIKVSQYIRLVHRLSPRR